MSSVFRAFVEDACLDGPEEVVDCPFRFVQCLLQGFGVGGIGVLGKEILVGVLCDVFQQIHILNQSDDMPQNKTLDPVLTDCPLLK